MDEKKYNFKTVSIKTNIHKELAETAKKYDLSISDFIGLFLVMFRNDFNSKIGTLSISKIKDIFDKNFKN